jgi:hypothetical protein
VLLSLIWSCSSVEVVEVPTTEVVETATAPAVCTNGCENYAPSWSGACPSGSRCLAFENASATETVYLSYQIGCNSDGKPGAPQCDCTNGPALAPGTSAFFTITNGDYAACPGVQPSWTPSCLTSGLAVVANDGAATCASGTRVEFTAGNTADPFGRADFYNLDVEPTQGGGVFYSIPVSMVPDLACAVDHANHDCRPLWCDSATCPDAYATPTTGGCPDGRSPQVGCQSTFTENRGLRVTYHPASGKSCQDAKDCP